MKTKTGETMYTNLEKMRKAPHAYWDKTGKFQNEYELLRRVLVPAADKSATVGGEMLRIVGNLYYDMFNNGACNWSNHADEARWLNARLKKLEAPSMLKSNPEQYDVIVDYVMAWLIGQWKADVIDPTEVLQ